MLKSRQIIAVIFLVGLAHAKPHSKPRHEDKGDNQVPIGPIDDWTCEWDGVFPNPEACDQFVWCDGETAVLWQCTNNMLFDLTYLGCNYAQYVHCEDRPRPTNVPSTQHPPSTTTFNPNATTVTTKPPSTNYTCESDGVFPHEKCEYYWQCFAGEAVLHHCQDDYLFDLVYMGCNYPELTHCGDRERPPNAKPTLYPSTSTTITTSTTKQTGSTTEYTGPSTTSTTTETPGDFQCPPDREGLFPDPRDCAGFYQCVAGVAYHNWCPNGLHFHPELLLCDYPSNVNCSVTPKQR